MFELIKILWEVLVLREAARKGQFNVRMGVIAFLFVFVAYAILIPAVALYEKHPEYKPVFIAACVLAAIDLILCFWWAVRTWRRQVAARKAIRDCSLDTTAQ